MQDAHAHTPANRDESVLVAALLAGEIPAFDALYTRYYEPVYRNALSLLKDQAAAEDIVQEVFLALWEKRNSLKDPANLAGWLFVTCSNKSLNYLRRHLRRKLSLQPVESLPDIAFIPDDARIADAQLLLLQAAICALPPQRRRVFELCKLEGHSYEGAAHLLGLSKNTIKSHMSTALEAVKAYILDQSGDTLLIAGLILALSTPY